MDFWYGFLKVISMLATGLFGALGLLTKYRDDGGKITRWGKTALGGIVLSSAISMILYTLETSRSKAASDEARRKADATTASLQEIIGTAQRTANDLGETLRQQRELAEKMDTSLTTQGQVLTGNENILSGVVNGARQDTEHTIGLLRTFWGQSNRIEASQIAVEITYSFPYVTKIGNPTILDKTWHLSLNALRGVTAKTRSIDPNAWSDYPLLNDEQSKPELSLAANDQKVTQRNNVGFAYGFDNGSEQRSYFSKFTGEMGKFSDMTNWNGAVVEVHLTSMEPWLFSGMDLVGRYSYEDSLKELAKRYDNIQDFKARMGPGFDMGALPVTANLVLYVRDRPVAQSEAIITWVTSGNHDTRSLVVAKFKITKVPEGSFPYFTPTLAGQ